MISYLKFLKHWFCKKYPVEITFFVTASCNFRCRHCFTWKKIEEANIKNELSVVEIKKITRTIPPFLRLSLSGGEPFLRNDLIEICQAFYDNCKVKFITIPTNASLSNKILEDCGEILKSCPKLNLHISLSLDEVGGNRDYVVGRTNTTPSLIETVKKLKALQKQYPNLTIGVITTQTQSNENRLEEIYEFALKELDVDNFGFNLVRLNPKYDNESKINLEIYKNFTQKLMKNKESSKLKFALKPFLVAKRNMVFRRVIKAHQNKGYQSPCYSGKSRIIINEIGDVYPCETLYYVYDKKFLMGNLRDYNLNFKKLCFSPKANKVKEHIRKTKCFCAHECDLETNILFNIKLLPCLLFEAVKNIFLK